MHSQDKRHPSCPVCFQAWLSMTVVMGSRAVPDIFCVLCQLKSIWNGYSIPIGEEGNRFTCLSCLQRTIEVAQLSFTCFVNAHEW